MDWFIRVRLEYYKEVILVKVESNIKVRFNETDQMGIVYHGNYFSWFDIGRMDYFDNLDITYKELEDKMLLLPVIDVKCSYIKPLRYGDVFKLITSIRKIKGVRIYFEYKLMLDDELMAEGESSHAFVDEDMMPINMRRAHKDIWNKLIESQED